MIVIGHRGAPEHAPENTLKSFSRAVEMGVRMVELDVHKCRSGELIVIHDERVDRTTDGKGLVKDLNFTQLRNFDAGEGEIVPSLCEVLEILPAEIAVNIEIKGPGAAEALSTFIENELPLTPKSAEDIIVSSFDLPQLHRFMNLQPEIKRGALHGGVPLHLGAFAEELMPWSYHYNREFINKELVDDAHSRGCKVFVYTVNYPEDIAAMEEMGVDGIFVNSPEILNRR